MASDCHFTDWDVIDLTNEHRHITPLSADTVEKGASVYVMVYQHAILHCHKLPLILLQQFRVLTNKRLGFLVNFLVPIT